jgi:heme-degrading monooxygenase HmoA
MYATVRTYSGNSVLADALVENEAAVKSLITGIEGFQAYYLVRTGDGAVSVSVFADEAGATESTAAAAGWIRENLPDAAGAAPQVSSGDVAIAF